MRIRSKLLHKWQIAATAFACSSCLTGLDVHAATMAGNNAEAQAICHVPAQLGQREGGVSLQEAIEIATRRYGGRVVSARTISRNGRMVHEIRIYADDGRVRTVRIDAETGEPE